MATQEEEVILLLVGRDGSLHSFTARDLARARLSQEGAERLLEMNREGEPCWWTEWRVIPVQ